MDDLERNQNASDDSLKKQRDQKETDIKQDAQKVDDRSREQRLAELRLRAQELSRKSAERGVPVEEQDRKADLKADEKAADRNDAHEQSQARDENQRELSFEDREWRRNNAGVPLDIDGARRMREQDQQQQERLSDTVATDRNRERIYEAREEHFAQLRDDLKNDSRAADTWKLSGPDSKMDPQAKAMAAKSQELNNDQLGRTLQKEIQSVETRRLNSVNKKVDGEDLEVLNTRRFVQDRREQGAVYQGQDNGKTYQKNPYEIAQDIHRNDFKVAALEKADRDFLFKKGRDQFLIRAESSYPDKLNAPDQRRLDEIKINIAVKEKEAQVRDMLKDRGPDVEHVREQTKQLAELQKQRSDMQLNHRSEEIRERTANAPAFKVRDEAHQQKMDHLVAHEKLRANELTRQTSAFEKQGEQGQTQTMGFDEQERKDRITQQALDRLQTKFKAEEKQREQGLDKSNERENELASMRQRSIDKLQEKHAQETSRNEERAQEQGRKLAPSKDGAENAKALEQRTEKIQEQRHAQAKEQAATKETSKETSQESSKNQSKERSQEQSHEREQPREQPREQEREQERTR